MTNFRKFEIRDSQSVSILMNKEKNYKIYRERLKYLDQLNLKKITILINGTESENLNIRRWIQEDQLRIDVVISKFKIHRTKASRFIDKRVHHLNRLRFNVLLLKRYPCGHSKDSKLIQSKRMFFNKLLSKSTKYLGFTQKLAKLEMESKAIKVLRKSDLIFFTFPVQQKSSEWQCRLVSWCAGRGVRCIFLVASWDNLTNRVPSAFGLPGEIVVWAQWQGEQAIELWGYNSNNVYTFNPLILLPKVFSVEEIEARSQKNLMNSLNVGYLGSSSGVIDPDIEFNLIKNLIELLSDLQKNERVKNVALSIRIHPLLVSGKTGINFDDLNLSQEIQCRFLQPEGQLGTIFKDEDVADLSNFICDSDVLIGINTSTMIEAQAGGAVVIAMPSSVCDKYVNHNFHAKQAEESEIYLLPATFIEMKELLIGIVEGHRNCLDLTINARRFLGSE
jgi:hypothetical protein